MKLYSIYDRAAGVYNAPFRALSDRDAIRSFQQSIMNADPSTPASFSPGDFDLFAIGDMDEVTGRLDALQVPEMLFRGVDVRVQHAQEHSVAS